MFSWLTDKLGDYFRSRWARIMLHAAFYLALAVGSYFMFAIEWQGKASGELGPLGMLIFGVVAVGAFIAVTLTSLVTWLILYLLGIVGSPPP